MLRFIVRTTDSSDAVYIGGPIETSYTTFDLDWPELEKFLKCGELYRRIEVIGAEILAEPTKPVAAAGTGQQVITDVKLSPVQHRQFEAAYKSATEAENRRRQREIDSKAFSEAQSARGIGDRIDTEKSMS